MNSSIASLTETLKQKRIRPSYQRLKVLEYLHEIQGHPTVEEIFGALTPEIPTLSKATIYNTLHTFVDAGLVRVISIDDAEMRYDIILSNHGHFKCDACGSIFNFAIDIDHFPIDGLKQFQIHEKNVFFKGLCPNCAVKPLPKEKE